MGNARSVYHTEITFVKLITAGRKKKQRSPGRHTSNTSKTNFRYLNTPEKQECYKKLKHRSRTAERRLSDVITKQMQDKGVILEPEIHNDIERIMEEKTGEIRENYPEDSLRRLFWEQQINALKTKEKCQLRWHPAIISNGASTSNSNPPGHTMHCAVQVF